MRLKEDIKTVAYMKTYASQLITKIQKTHHPVIITQNGEAKAVLQDINSYEKIRNAFLILKLLVQGENDISKDNVLENEVVMKRFEEKLMSGKR
ncbi:type II toxin-antitoxin system Phd/YefM family antitoxin [Candidatus Desantisbacteria bacterium CG_4_8_14_3_um_filter_40_12]|uniref:Antitoxin n=1 Tax=Candidatus Desantisbacteria bacterium CG_4_8_14_3_um_filter_40_12 TaxID=1974545 RepID=A0A2M7JET5_9BACT|nr:MAG: type II toxin-antitoxin system Phd/YefM family antitoxin [Candidatus Desantisbacteria bacterium CG_4_8_14_3_um_filter_40_12]